MVELTLIKDDSEMVFGILFIFASLILFLTLFVIFALVFVFIMWSWESLAAASVGCTAITFFLIWYFIYKHFIGRRKKSINFSRGRVTMEKINGEKEAIVLRRGEVNISVDTEFITMSDYKGTSFFLHESYFKEGEFELLRSELVEFLRENEIPTNTPIG